MEILWKSHGAGPLPGHSAAPPFSVPPCRAVAPRSPWAAPGAAPALRQRGATKHPHRRGPPAAKPPGGHPSDGYSLEIFLSIYLSFYLSIYLYIYIYIYP